MPSMNELAAQLRCPSGERAIEIGENMFESNRRMIFKTIDTLFLETRNRVLEIGFGNGKHLSYLLQKTLGLVYQGVETSTEMVAAAQTNNSKNRATFEWIDGGGKLPFPRGWFDRVFTVNTIYFWKDVPFQLEEIYRVLKIGGRIAVAYIDKNFGEKLPFTQSGFSFIETVDLEHLLESTGFRQIATELHTDNIISKDGQPVLRPYYITVAEK